MEAVGIPQLVAAPARKAPPGDQVAAALVARAETGLDQQDAPDQIPVLAPDARLDRHASSVQVFGEGRDRWLR